MKKQLILTAMLCLLGVSAFAQWKPAGNMIKTQWADKVDPQNVLPEYPRPLLQRDAWANLNGLWDYAIKPIGENTPTKYDGKILVPFCIESSLSGVQKKVGEDNELWYHRTFKVPSKWSKKDVLLNFGAIDWRADVYLNGQHIATHEGGYTPFSVNITPFLKKGEQDLAIRVYDATDHSYQPCGKQSIQQGKIFYTSVTGIWQTVWMEPVNATHINNVSMVSDVKGSRINFTVDATNSEGKMALVKLLDNGQTVATAKTAVGQKIALTVQNPKLWSPDSPFLYDVEVSLLSSNGKVLDKAKSYTAFREISKIRDDDGIYRFLLNGKKTFMFGPLDQGWWPDGLYTAPTDEALKFDIEKTKQWGFNMIRKHVKVEPARWYYYCDKLGMLVWQDMPSSDRGGYWDPKTDQQVVTSKWAPFEYGTGVDRQRSAASKDNYYREWKDVMNFCSNNPSVVVWIPFNEAWGQFDTEKVVAWTQQQDPSRLVNPASGGNHFQCGDIMDIHHYPNPKRFYLYDPMRITVLGEFGGIGMPVEDHTWKGRDGWGYVQFKTSEEVTNEYIKFAKELETLARRGYSGGVYTQTTDVEGELNGIMTYDRKVVKMDEDKISQINKEVINAVK
jgi:beta-galactosidase/beta-glucuronidase